MATQEEFEDAARQLRVWAGRLDTSATTVSQLSADTGVAGGTVTVAVDESMGLITNNLLAAADELAPLADECDVRAARCEQHKRDLAQWESDLRAWESDMAVYQTAKDHPSFPGATEVIWPGEAPQRPVAPAWVDPQ